MQPNKNKTVVIENIDVKLLREQRDALLVSIDDAEDFIQYGSGETKEYRDKQIQLLDGLINMVEVILDEAEGVNASR